MSAPAEDPWCTSCGIHRASTGSPLCPVCTEGEPEPEPEPPPLHAATAVLNALPRRHEGHW
jgi:hypothetical protein